MDLVFSDQSHIDRVREALWQRSGRASVMIGAGFSRCASKARPDACYPPLLEDLTKLFFAKLYPSANVLDSSSVKLATRSFPRLAQEYQAAFGRSEMNRFLKDVIRDDDLSPGELHLRLMRLPWRDVFTTNWDTLLERASALVAECKYGIVRNKKEISLVDGPRIVKLHGSFPAYFPLITTEEDYRKYPIQFAPFVNTVQQAMMETVLCLVGFSGDDPNFLHWSGWVRDNLGTSAPKIYLAGWLDLSPHQRNMLETNGVVPIDLALHPRGHEWPEHLRHHNAVNWILHTLERGRHYDLTDWPTRRTWSYGAIPDDLQPVVELEFVTPQDEWWSFPQSRSEESSSEVNRVLGIWSQNRRLYPGWLAVPGGVRSEFSIKTNEQEGRILEALPSFTPSRRLNAIRELVWRREVLLDPISSALESAGEEVLQQIDCQARRIDGVVDGDIDWRDVREAWVAVALSLVTSARHRFDQEVFAKRIDALSSFRNDSPDVVQRICHEECLWAVYSMDFPKLQSLLKNWPTEDYDPMWMVRKAALLYEANCIDEAAGLCDRALRAIRQTPDDGRSVASPSREGWTLFLRWALDWAKWNAHEADTPHMGPFERRWRELAPLRCDALSERDGYINSMKPRAEQVDVPLFDLDVSRRPGYVFSREDYNRWVAARRAVRLAEVGGLPPTETHLFKTAIEELSKSEPELAIRLCLRILTYDKEPVLQRVLTRSRVATLELELAEAIAATCEDITAHVSDVGRREVGGRFMFRDERMRVAIEVLSRLVVRFEPDRVESCFEKALQYYENEGRVNDLWLADPVRNMLKRSWEALPVSRRTDRIIDLLGAPIVGTGSLSGVSDHYPDPGELLRDDLPPPARGSGDQSRWQEIVGFLVRGLETGGETRRRAAVRIAFVAIWRLLSDVEAQAVARALWKDVPDNGDLPVETSLADWVFLLLPELEGGAAERGFRRKWLSGKKDGSGSSRSPGDIILQVGLALYRLARHGYRLSLSSDERVYLTEVIDKWLAEPIPPPGIVGRNQLAKIRETIQSLPGILSEAILPPSTGQELYGKLQMLQDSGIPGYECVVGVALALPDRMQEVSSWMRLGLLSDDDQFAEAAMRGLQYWLEAANSPDCRLQAPPEDLVQEIGVVIATRRKASLKEALHAGKWIFEEGSSYQQKLIQDLTLKGLEYLFEELRYDRDVASENDLKLPVLRWRAVQLASAMANRELEDDTIVTRWLDVAKTDPLAEVRYAGEPASMREEEDAITVPDARG